ncbi:MAG: hypothetical protein M0022_06775 [Desulfobacteraceae bacterium]|nr:hypothetical protein [Desulfobacteraceae bacterium]
MNLITFGFSEKSTPVFLNQEPFQQVGTMYLMKAGENSVIGITLDDKILKIAKAPGKARRSRRAKAEVAEAEATPKKRAGRKPKSKTAGATPAQRGRKLSKIKARKEKVVKKPQAEEKLAEA